ncbi:hypothetical protein O181_068632 [Austropuccinia psidii MF-1]|uniref:Uncharacterized protein n=1 Tax=Austropuccinia psidii MF-1 TaxID=1389203 RepID=A0A9Q3F2T4_9BASI|nr:hypothetical protein [Austropuccinia psidii MF-1]
MSQPRVWPSSLMAAAIQPGAKLGPVGHVISFMTNWPPWVFYGIHAIPPFNGHFMASGHILPSLAFLASSHFTNSQAFIFDFGPGGSFCLLGASRPPSHRFWIQGHPFHYWGFGLNGLLGHLGLLRPMGRDSRSTGHLGPFWPNPMRPKGPARWVPNHNWAHLSQFWPPSSWTQKMTKKLMDTILAINPVGPNFGHGPPWTNSSAMASGNHQISPACLSPQLQGFLPFLHTIRTQGCRHGT